MDAAAFAIAYSDMMCLARGGHLIDRGTRECAVCLKPWKLISRDDDPHEFQD